MSTDLYRIPRHAPAEVFWGDLAPADHAVQIYANQEMLLDALEGFVGSGLRSGAANIVIATAVNRQALERRLRRRGFDLDTATASGAYISADAQTTLAQFMVNGMPDAARFRAVVGSLLARGQGRPVRAFGEMVVLLWKQGQQAATLRLEELWNEVCAQERIALFCAYPEAVFSQDPSHGLSEVCTRHSHVFSM